MDEKIKKARILLDALPYIKKYSGTVFVIKYGGSAQIDPALKKSFAEDIFMMYLMGIKVVIVHGGGNKISAFLDKLNIESEFKDGLRVTSEATMEIVEMVLSGNVNKEITALINQHGGKAIGVSGKDANFITATAIDREKYGLVGKITEIDSTVIKNLLNQNFIPVIAPIATDTSTNLENSHLGYNINADLAASQIAIALNARKIIFMTDIAGVMSKERALFSTLKKKDIEMLKADGTIAGGMIPKVDACIEAIDGGVIKTHIIDGRVEHALLLESFTSQGVGTVIK